MKIITPFLGLLALSIAATGTAPALMQTATAFDLEVIDTTGLQVVNARDMPPKGLKRYEIDHRHTPVIRVEPGEKFVVITEDAMDGNLLVDGRYTKTPKDLEVWNHDPPNYNPSGGPIYIKGCTKEDVVAIKIHSVKPA